MMKVLVGLFLLTQYIFCQSWIKVDPDSSFLVDEYGRVRLFHGVNAVYKIPPWQPITDHFDPQNSISAEDIANLQEWGFTIIRLGVMWPGVEPENDSFNSTYLENMYNLIQALGDAGIYTLVDCHQDVLSREYCGEGVPDWAITFGKPNVKPFPEPIASEYSENENGYPFIDTCLSKSFADYYFSDTVAALFQSLYSNYNGMQDHFAQYWQKVAETFSNASSVIGYELINEPFFGDIYEFPFLLEPGKADLLNLQPMYIRLNDEIRKVDNEHIIFFERSVADTIFRAGFTQAPGGPAYNDRQVFSFHVYCAPVDGEGDPTNEIECDFADTLLFEEMLSDARRLGVGSMLTEFGAMSNDTKGIQNLAYLTNKAETSFQGWIYWQFKFFQDLTTQGEGESFYGTDGSLQTNKVKALSRTYARAIAGIPDSTKFQPETGHFSLVFYPDPTITEPTEIYLNEAFYYPSGFKYSISPEEAISKVVISHNSIFLTNNQSWTGEDVTLFVSATH